MPPEAGLPFAALRVISDPADRSLPALAKSRDQAERRYRPAQGAARRRAQSAALRALVSTGIDFNRALRSLRGCRGFLLGGEGFVPADL